MRASLEKKPKVEEYEQEPEHHHHHHDHDSESNSQDQEEEALIALLEHRNKEVHHLRTRVTYYNSKVSFTSAAVRNWVDC